MPDEPSSCFVYIFKYNIFLFIYKDGLYGYNKTVRRCVILERFGKPGIIERFEQLDLDLLAVVGDEKRVELTIVGSGALIMLNLVGDSRVTTDIDVMETEKQIEGFLERYDMNQLVSTFLYRLPENWIQRRQRIPFDGIVLDVYAPSNEDLAILKIDAYRDADQKDLREMINGEEINFDRLMTIINNEAELRVNYADDSEWEAFLFRLNEIKAFADSMRGQE